MTFVLLIRQEATISSSPSPWLLCYLDCLTFPVQSYNVTVEQIYSWKRMKNYIWNLRNSIDSWPTWKYKDLKSQRRRRWCNRSTFCLWNQFSTVDVDVWPHLFWFILGELQKWDRNPQNRLCVSTSYTRISYSHIDKVSPLRTSTASHNCTLTF